MPQYNSITNNKKKKKKKKKKNPYETFFSLEYSKLQQINIALNLPLLNEIDHLSKALKILKWISLPYISIWPFSFFYCEEYFHYTGVVNNMFPKVALGFFLMT